MGFRQIATGWRMWLLGAGSCAVLAGSLLAPSQVKSQDRAPGTGDQAGEYEPVEFSEWFNPIDTTQDTGPLIVCYDGTHPPAQDFMDALHEQLYNAGRLAESYHIFYPNGQYLPNRHDLPHGLGLSGPAGRKITFSWWESEVNPDGDGEGGGGDTRYYLGSRWSGSQGSPRALTWSLVKDGTSIPGGAGEPTAASELFSRMDSLYASQGGRATWILRIQQCFDRWAAITGLSYTRVNQAPNGDGNNDDDDGAAFSSSGGSAGLRGDIRMSMHPIDGTNGILAYTFFPSNGDMVFDRAENWGNSTNMNRFLRNTVMHEHGHGIGMDHVCSNNANFLMEPFLNTAFDGPQHDDIRGAHRHYGDNEEADDTTGTANSLGTIAVGTTNNTFCNLPAPTTGTNPANTSACSIDANGEQDFYSFAVTTSCAVTVTVTPLGFTYQDNNENVCSSGTTTTNSLTRANLAVELRSTNGTTVLATAQGAAAGVAETIAASPLAAAGTYFIRVFETDSPTQTQLYSLSVSITSTGCTGPTVNTHPNGDTLCVNDSITFSVTATGTAPLSYQWRKDLANIPSATGTSYSIASISLGDAGDYDCVVSNACGSDISNPATLDVINDPDITSDPADQTVNEGQTAIFSVVSDGTLFQWRKNGNPLSNGGNISGATSAVLSISNAQDSDEGVYTCDVQNGCGSVTSAGATLTVECHTPVITQDPASQTVTAGTTANFSVGSDGATFLWRKDGNPLSDGGNISGATTATLAISNAQDSDEGVYSVDVQNACGAVTSAGATLTVEPATNDCLGDFNHDLVIDLADLTIILSNFGLSGGADQGDMNGDTFVDLADLSAFLALFGSSCP